MPNSEATKRRVKKQAGFERLQHIANHPNLFSFLISLRQEPKSELESHRRSGSWKACAFMVALPWCHFTLKAPKPKSLSYPAELRTIGDELRAKRLDRGLLQREVARQIGVTTCPIMYWETNRVAPALRFLPKITEFLGYDPCADRQPQSFGDQLRAHRRKLGRSQKEVAVLLGIDQSTLASWEREEHRPAKRSLQLIDEFL